MQLSVFMLPTAALVTMVVMEARYHTRGFSDSQNLKSPGLAQCEGETTDPVLASIGAK